MTTNIGEKISVCLLTYNHANVIESTLQSILAQTAMGFELLVSDDCSTDGTWERILEIASNDWRVKAIQTPQNLGMPGNANFAVAQSLRPYIALLHHDDLYRKDLLQQWGSVLDQHPDIAFVFNAYSVYQSNRVYSEPIPAGRIDGRWLLEKYLFPRWGCVVRGTAMIRREAWEQAGGMRERFGLLADVDLWMRLCMRWAVGYVPEPVIVVRHQRPSYYPNIYTGGRANWSWQRYRILLEIHAENRKDYFKMSTRLGPWKWWVFRSRVSLQTAKWLTYAWVRRQWHMIETCEESTTPYDQAWLRVLRQLVRSAARPLMADDRGFY